MKGWKELGMVETIYEEDYENCSSSSSSSSSSNYSQCPSQATQASPSSPLQDTVKAWSAATGVEANIFIHVEDQCFKLHKDPLTSRSGYLQRHLKDSSEHILSPPLKITAETFSSVATFCYGSPAIITPFNVAALRIAAELLEMTSEEDGDQNLKQKTETYFRQAVSVNREYATVVLRSCLCLLPEAEETASLASRCIEALDMVDGVNGAKGWIDDVMSLSAEEFKIIADSMQRRLTNDHDLLYRLVDLYLKVERGSRFTEEQKTQICNLVDCEKLSPQFLMHAVQNATMPLRFVVRAMFLAQLTTRRSIISMASIDSHQTLTKPRPNHNHHDAITLGAILQRDAALRQVAELKDLMERTSSKIESLERDLMGMKQQLRESGKKMRSEEASLLNTESSGRRSLSFRFSSERNTSVVEQLRDHGLGSSASFRYSDDRKQRNINGSSSCSSSSEDHHRSFYNENENSRSSTDQKSGFGRKLMKGLKTAFRKSAKQPESTESRSTRPNGDAGVTNVDEVLDGITKGEAQLTSTHRRSLSLL